jgi:chromosome partitioning protein
MMMAERMDRLVGDHATRLSNRLQGLRAQLPSPAAKTFRRLSATEAAALLNITEQDLRRLEDTPQAPAPELLPGGRRSYSLADIHSLRAYLNQHPGRQGKDHLQVIAVINFKGGSGKTTTAAHLAQKAALDGYRVLAIDLDPQASLSALHGFQPELDLTEGGTLYDAIRYEDPLPVSHVIRTTHIAGLDIIPGNLELMEFEHDTPRVLAKRQGQFFFTRIGDVLSEVEDRYDLVIMDCPPQLGFLTMAGLSAATAVLVTVHPQMLDVMSMSQFLLMTSDLLGVVAEAGADMDYDWMRYVLTRVEPTDAPQAQIVQFLRTLFPDHVLENPMLKTTAISDAGITKETLYEIDRAQFSRGTYDRAMGSLNAVNGEILNLVQTAWGRPG